QLAGWVGGDAPPAAVGNSLQGLVSKLRRTLGSADLVAMRGDGYALELPSDAIDAPRVARLVAAGRAAPPAFTSGAFAAGAIVRLSEQRLAVLEERLDIELRLGRHQSAIVELE